MRPRSGPPTNTIARLIPDPQQGIFDEAPNKKLPEVPILPKQNC